MKIIRRVINLKVTNIRIILKKKTTILKIILSLVIELVFSCILKKIINISLRRKLLLLISRHLKLEISTKHEILLISKIDTTSMWFRKENWTTRTTKSGKKYNFIKAIKLTEEFKITQKNECYSNKLVGWQWTYEQYLIVSVGWLNKFLW